MQDRGEYFESVILQHLVRTILTKWTLYKNANMTDQKNVLSKLLA
jgi:hypothetical protein